ncbi:hypothetical protein FS837_003640 [Tulasnella sp. UAMH 9824]|nr:hypothetical protein FS837_003640 [Tulasnella sp. UAMH 9824]
MDRFIPSVQTMIKGSAASVAGGAALAAGLLYYGQGFLIYPSGFPQGSRQTVATPMEYNMIYHDVTLETPDKLKIRAYLMLQREDVPNTKGAYQQMHLNWKSKRKEEGKQLRTMSGTFGSSSSAKAEKEDGAAAEGSVEEGIRIDPEMSEHDREVPCPTRSCSYEASFYKCFRIGYWTAGSAVKTNDYDLPRERWKPRSSTALSKAILRPNEMQCVYAFI